MAKLTVRAGGYQGAASVHSRALAVLAEALEATGGVAEITGNVTALGRKATDLFGMTETGELDLCYFASSYLADRVPNLAVLDLPFCFTDRAAVFKALDSAIGQALARDIAARMELKGETLEASARHLIFNVLKPDDGGIIAIDRNGTIVMLFNGEGMFRAASDSGGMSVVKIWE